MFSIANAPANPAWWIATLFIAARLGGLFLLAPPLSATFLPASVRVAVVLCLSVCLATLPSIHVPASPSLGFVVVGLTTEVALGATMALGVSLAFSAFAVGARLLDVQIGFGMGQVFDPLTRQQLPVLSAAFNLLAIALIFATDAHHLLLRGFAVSLELLPPGGGWSIEQAASPLIKQVAATFSLGFVMVAPVVVCLLLVELSLGVLSRNLPQMNMFALAIPIKVVVGVGTLTLFLPTLSNVTLRVNDSIFKAWEAMFR